MLPMVGGLIGRKLDEALLPSRGPVNVWVGYGPPGTQCDACDTPILPVQPE